MKQVRSIMQVSKRQNDGVEMMMMDQKGLESKILWTVAGPAVSCYLHSTSRKVKSTENEDDSGTEDINGSRHERLLKKQPIKSTSADSYRA